MLPITFKSSPVQEFIEKSAFKLDIPGEPDNYYIIRYSGTTGVRGLNIIGPGFDPDSKPPAVSTWKHPNKHLAKVHVRGVPDIEPIPLDDFARCISKSWVGAEGVK